MPAPDPSLTLRSQTRLARVELIVRRAYTAVFAEAVGAWRDQILHHAAVDPTAVIDDAVTRWLPMAAAVTVTSTWLGQVRDPDPEDILAAEQTAATRLDVALADILTSSFDDVTAVLQAPGLTEDERRDQVSRVLQLDLPSGLNVTGSFNAELTPERAAIVAQRTFTSLDRLARLDIRAALVTARGGHRSEVDAMAREKLLSRVKTLTAELYDYPDALTAAAKRRTVTLRAKAERAAAAAAVSEYNQQTRDYADSTLGEAAILTWLATPDALTRISHRIADGQEVRGAEFFTVGGAPLAYPGDPRGPAEEVKNCRCTLLVTDDPDILAPAEITAAALDWDMILASVESDVITFQGCGGLQPGGPPLWKTPGLRLPAYIRRIALAVCRQSGDPSRSVAIAVAAVKRACATGRWPNRGEVTGATRARACSAVAQWEAAKARARATPNR